MPFGIDKAKIKFYSFVNCLYYGMNLDYASLLWVEFDSSVNHSKKTTELYSAGF